jgi:hypothetical protein
MSMVITLLTMTSNSNMLVLAFATLCGATEIASFLFYFAMPQVAKANTAVTVTNLSHVCIGNILRWKCQQQRQRTVAIVLALATLGDVIQI